MRRKIPSSITLSVFEAAVRHSSFTLAAQDLSLTQSAVCRQIGALESYLGVALFRRSGRGVAPTPAALEYSERVGTCFDMLERDTAELIARGDSGGELTVAALPTFASRWLIPRLPRFYAAQPQVTVNLLTRTRPFLFAQSGIDAAIFARNADWPGTQQTFLMDEDLVAVASPALAGTARPARAAAAAAAGRTASDRARAVGLTADGFARHRLLHLDTRPQAWRQWFDAQGLKVAGDSVGPRFETFALMADSAVHGLGLALAPRFLVEDELRAGRLVEVKPRGVAAGARAPAPPSASNSTAYFLICPETRKADPALEAFRDWLVAECAQARGAAPDPRGRA